MLSDLPISHSMTVLLGLGVTAVLIIIVCIVAAIIYKARFAKLEKDSQKSLVDGGDKTDMSVFFSEKYKNEGSKGLRKDEF